MYFNSPDSSNFSTVWPPECLDCFLIFLYNYSFLSVLYRFNYCLMESRDWRFVIFISTHKYSTLMMKQSVRIFLFASWINCGSVRGIHNLPLHFHLQNCDFKKRLQTFFLWIVLVLKAIEKWSLRLLHTTVHWSVSSCELRVFSLKCVSFTLTVGDELVREGFQMCEWWRTDADVNRSRGKDLRCDQGEGRHWSLLTACVRFSSHRTIWLFAQRV